MVQSLIQSHKRLCGKARKKTGPLAQQAPTPSPRAFSTDSGQLKGPKGPEDRPQDSELGQRHDMDKVNTVTEQSTQCAQTLLARLQAPWMGSQSASCPSKELGRPVSGNPEPDK